MQNRFRLLRALVHAALIMLIVVGLYLVSRYSYLLFHTLVELFTIAIGWSFFTLVWNTRRWTENRHLFLLGVAFAFVGVIDLLHTLAYKGMNIFAGYDTDLSIQLWVAARYLQGVSILLAALLFGGNDGAAKREKTQAWEYAVVAAYAAVTLLFLVLIFLRLFPTCYVEGIGLTSFKRASEYIISAMLLATLSLLWRRRARFDPAMLRLLIAAIVLIAISEPIFAFYVDAYDFLNLVGHYAKLAASYLLYLAVIQNGLQRPYETLFRELAGRERLYRQMFTEHPAVKLLIDPTDGAIVEANPAAAQFYGYPIETLQTMSIAQINTLPREQILFEMEAARSHKQNYFTFQHCLADGSVRDVEVYSAPIEVAGRELLYSIVHDVTERKRVEDSLRRSEERFRQIVHLAPVGVGVVDSKGNLIECNAALSRMIGYSREELLSQNFTDFTHPDDLEREWQLIRELWEGQRTEYRMEKRYIHKDGHLVWVNVAAALLADKAGELRHGFAFVQDITEQRRTEEALREHKALLDAVGRMARVGGWELDAATNRVTWTEETYRIHEVPLDYEPPLDEAINFFHPDDRGRLTMAIQRALEYGEPYDMELRFITAQGRQLWTHTMCQPQVVDGKVVKLIGSFQDITERKEMEEALRASEERYRSLFENNHAVMLLIDPTNGAIVDANPAAARYYGWTREELQQKKIGQINTLPPEEVQAEMARARREERNHFLFRHRRADGSIRDVEVYSGPFSVQGRTLLYSIIHDITERRQLEEKLRETTHTLQAVVEAAPVAITLLDPDGIVKLWNPAAEATFGWNAEEVIGHKHPIIPPNEYDSFRATLAATLQGRPVRNEERRRLRKDRTLIDVSLSTAPLFDAHGHPVGVVGILADITDRKRAEEQIRQDAQIKAELLREINHRVGNNLNLLLLLLENDLERAQNEETRAELLDLLGRIRSMSDVHQILQHTQWKPVELGSLAYEVVNGVLIGTSQTGVQVQIIWPPEPIWVGPKQAFMLGLILNELTTNCVKYAFREPKGDKKIDLRIMPSGPGRAHLEFRDNGPGWPTDVLTGQRTGTGLELIKMWVEGGMHRQIELYNNGGAVLAFEIALELSN